MYVLTIFHSWFHTFFKCVFYVFECVWMFLKVREGWSRLEKVREGWRRSEKVREGWSRLEKVRESMKHMWEQNYEKYDQVRTSMKTCVLGVRASWPRWSVRARGPSSAILLSLRPTPSTSSSGSTGRASTVTATHWSSFLVIPRNYWDLPGFTVIY